MDTLRENRRFVWPVRSITACKLGREPRYAPMTMAWSSVESGLSCGLFCAKVHVGFPFSSQRNGESEPRALPARLRYVRRDCRERLRVSSATQAANAAP